MRITKIRTRRLLRYIRFTNSEARTLIDGLDALYRETGKEYGNLRSGLIGFVYGKPPEPLLVERYNLEAKPSTD